LAILIRPALIIVGLIGGYMIFIAGTYLMSLLFDQVLNVATGSDVAGAQIMVFTLIFAYLVYTIGTISFKMIDTVPQQIIRWLGSGAQTFSDGKGDPFGSAQGVVAGAAVVGTQIAGELSKGAKGAGQGFQQRRQQKQKDNEQAQAAATASRRHDDQMEAQGMGRPEGTDPLSKSKDSS
jgi:hypothetical protein